MKTEKKKNVYSFRLDDMDLAKLDEAVRNLAGEAEKQKEVEVKEK